VAEDSIDSGKDYRRDSITQPAMATQSIRNSSTVQRTSPVPAPKVETYSKELDSTIRYVQYLPKGFRNLNLEQAVNTIYHDKQFKI
jgi:hypothetical protein